MLLTAEGKLDDAGLLLVQAASVNPKSAAIQGKLGDLYERQGKKAQALAAYRAALALSPDSVLAKEGAARLSKP